MNRYSPRVRLVVPTTGERLSYLHQCLDSIRRQEEPIDVVIVAPSAAADSLRGLTDLYQCRLLVERARGISHAVNQGWEDAHTDYLTWLGDDDLLAPGSMAAAVAALDADPAATMVYGRVRTIDGDGHHVYTMRPGRCAPWFLRYGPNFVWQQGSLYRHRVVREVGMLDPRLRYAMDFDLHLRLWQQGTLRYLPRVLGCYRLHPTSLTVTNPDPHRERRLVMRRYLGPTARSLESCWWPVAKGANRVWGATQFHAGRRYAAR